MNRFAAVVAACVIGCSTGHVEASITYYFNRNAFEAALGVATLPGFESFETSFTSASTVQFPIGGTAQFSISSNTGNVQPLSGANGSNTHGSKVATINDGSATVATFHFAAPINVFGLDITDAFADELQATSLQTVTVRGDLGTSFNLAEATPTFFGAINVVGTFEKVTFDVSGSQMGIDFDQVVYGNVDLSGSGIIPEPTSALAWLGLGCAAARGAVRRRGRAAC